MDERVVYLVTTKGCYGCAIMTNLVQDLQNDEDISGFNLVITEFKNLPEYIQVDVPFDDFPTLVFVKNNVIKYHSSGTMTYKKLKSIAKGIDF